MPVVQKTGPDGCLYVLDWYDRYHCYQDARRDPEGIDRLKGRLYRVRYEDTPRAAPFDLAAESDAQLIERLHSPNVYFRDIAQRLLVRAERSGNAAKARAAGPRRSAPRKARMHALWALVGGGPLVGRVSPGAAGARRPGLSRLGRAGGRQLRARSTRRCAQKVVSLARDPAADVRLQVAIAARKLDGVDALPLLLDVLAAQRRRPADSAHRLAEPAPAAGGAEPSSSCS